MKNRIKPRDSRNIFFKDGTYWIDIRINGERFREKAGQTERAARAYRDDLRAWGRAVKKNQTGVVRPEGPPVTFEAFAVDYLALYARRKRSCERDERSIAHLKRFFAKMRLQDIGAESVARYRASREGISVATVNRELACLRTILYKAVEYNRLAAYPLMKNLLEKEPAFKPRILEFDEAARIWKAADPRVLRDAIVLYLETGMRLREVLGLPHSDVDFKRAELTVTAARAKNGKARTIPLSPRALEVLRSRPGREYFFENPTTGRPFHSIDAAWATAKEKAGITGRLRIHDLRDSFATWRLRAGVDIRTVSELIGDSPEMTLRRYCHSDARTKRAAVENLPDFTSRSGQNLHETPDGEGATSSKYAN